MISPLNRQKLESLIPEFAMFRQHETEFRVGIAKKAAFKLMKLIRPATDLNDPALWDEELTVMSNVDQMFHKALVPDEILELFDMDSIINRSPEKEHVGMYAVLNDMLNTPQQAHFDVRWLLAHADDCGATVEEWICGAQNETQAMFLPLLNQTFGNISVRNTLESGHASHIPEISKVIRDIVSMLPSHGHLRYRIVDIPSLHEPFDDATDYDVLRNDIVGYIMRVLKENGLGNVPVDAVDGYLAAMDGFPIEGSMYSPPDLLLVGNVDQIIKHGVEIEGHVEKEFMEMHLGGDWSVGRRRYVLDCMRNALFCSNVTTSKEIIASLSAADPSVELFYETIDAWINQEHTRKRSRFIGSDLKDRLSDLIDLLVDREIEHTITEDDAMTLERWSRIAYEWD